MLEVFVEHQAVQMLRGNIYVGKVSRVVPALQSAFIDIGLEKMAFLHVTEVVSENGHGDEQSHQPIQKLLREGQSVICLLYTSPSPRDATLSRMPSSA